MLDNLSTGVIDITANGDAIDTKGSSALIDNAGKIDKTAGTGTSDIYVSLNNTGTLESDTGTIVLHDGATLSGTVSGAGAVALRGSSDYTLNSTLTLSVDYLDLWDSADLTFDKPGRLAYANAGPDTNGSQFYITEVATPFLNGKYTIFGQCDDATVALVKQIAAMARDPMNDRPFRPVKIVHVKITYGAAAAKPPATATKPAAPSTN